MMTSTCKHCGLTLQGSDNEGEDICVDCLADLCFPSNYNIKEGCIRQSLNLPLTDKEREQSSSKASECDESEANQEETEL